MAKEVFRLVHEVARARALAAVRAAPAGHVITLEEPKRTLDQNALWWPQLTEISRQALHPVNATRLPPEWWRMVLLDTLGQEQPRVPSLDGSHDVPIGLSSSKLSKREFSDLIELTYKVGSELGVLFHDRVAA